MVSAIMLTTTHYIPTTLTKFFTQTMGAYVSKSPIVVTQVTSTPSGTITPADLTATTSKTGTRIPSAPRATAPSIGTSTTSTSFLSQRITASIPALSSQLHISSPHTSYYLSATPSYPNSGDNHPSATTLVINSTAKITSSSGPSHSPHLLPL